MSFSALLSKMLVLFVFICIGVLCTKVHFIDEHGAACLNKLVLYICGPMMVLRSVQSMDLAYGLPDVLKLLLYGTILNTLTVAVALITSRLICRKSSLKGVFSLVTAFGNMIFMGIPVISALYGDGAVFLLSICAVPFNIFIFSVGILLLIGGEKQKIPWKKVLLNPSLYATLIALLFFFTRIELPAPAVEVISYLGQMVVPLSMILIGSALGRMSIRTIFGNRLNYAVCAIKLILMPILSFLLFRQFVSDPLVLGMMTVMGAMPSASISPILCAEYGGDSDFASRSVFLTTLLSLITIPLMTWILL